MIMIINCYKRNNAAEGWDSKLLRWSLCEVQKMILLRFLLLCVNLCEQYFYVNVLYICTKYDDASCPIAIDQQSEE
jgi:hypothetical protein